MEMSLAVWRVIHRTKMYLDQRGCVLELSTTELTPAMTRQVARMGI